MKITSLTLGGLYVIMTKALASSASEGTAGPKPVEGTPINCTGKQELTSNVSQPNTTVAVTCPTKGEFTPKFPSDGGKDVCFDKDCKEQGALSSVCPGGSAAKVLDAKNGATTVNVYIPQLPATQQVIYLKCKEDANVDCTAMIVVAPASPQGPQACAAPGKSVTLRVNQAGGSAQFACGGKLTLAPSNPTQAYADDCSKVETLKDMTRTDEPGDYSTLTVKKLRKKKLCYLCGKGGERAGEGVPCTVYVEVSGTRRLCISVSFGFTLSCLVAMLGFT